MTDQNFEKQVLEAVLNTPVERWALGAKGQRDPHSGGFTLKAGLVVCRTDGGAVVELYRNDNPITDPRNYYLTVDGVDVASAFEYTWFEDMAGKRGGDVVLIKLFNEIHARLQEQSDQQRRQDVLDKL
jgi:hypothetical protein